MAGKIIFQIAFGCINVPVWASNNAHPQLSSQLALSLKRPFVSLIITNQTGVSPAHTAGPVVSVREMILRTSFIKTIPSGNWPVSRNTLTTSGCV
ncbi:hypothetical protein NX761_10720 [Nitrosomonas sp. PLL12]|nr:MULTISPECIES: hypothetical protein [Nitrosomonas]UVS60015.1 hypothetical protein NX761_10720 [Nitrosomonas sp. PLL12]